MSGTMLSAQNTQSVTVIVAFKLGSCLTIPWPSEIPDLPTGSRWFAVQ